MPSTSALATAQFVLPIPGGLIIDTAKRIHEYLDGFTKDIWVISSRAFKANVAPDCKRRNWAKATDLANQDSDLWTKRGGSFMRPDYECIFGEDAEAVLASPPEKRLGD